MLLEWAAGGEDVAADLERGLNELEHEIDTAETKKMLSGEHDNSAAIVTIHPGAGGVDSQDWAEMLLRMYLKWAEKRGLRREVIDYQPGEEAGLKSVTLLLEGDYAFGLMSAEAGVHRLVRISPYDSNARRHTSFASVWVYPVIDDTIVVDIKESDVRTDTYRASGSGGQHINKTDSAVRLTHAPTGIVVAVQAERSQHKNRAKAWDMLRARIYEMELKKQEAALQAEADSKTEIGWGRQIRSYVLQPYQMVKDLRTGVETSDTGGVLDGDLEAFLQASLSHKLGPETAVQDLD